MSHRPDRHHRRSIRLRGFDYAQPGAYFITLCIHGSLPLLGHVLDGAMSLSPAGAAIETDWLALPERFADLHLDSYCLMPDHLHGILILGDCPALARSPVDAAGRGAMDGGQRQALPLQDVPDSARHSLADIIQAFKSLSTRTYIGGVREHEWPPFEGRLWQRNYWERIIRNERELLAVRDYIERNPQSWTAREHLG